MSQQWMYISAQDVWMFRDNKPFTASQNFTARSIFPPSPLTMQGIIRTHYLEQKFNVDWDAFGKGQASAEIYQAAGKPGGKDLGKLQITGPFVAKNIGGKLERLYPAPLDLRYHSDKKQYALPSPTAASFQTDAPFAGWKPLLLDREAGKEISGWLTEAQFQAYCTGKASTIQGAPIDTDEIYLRESRPGLAIDYSRRANRDSHFYRAEFIRPNDGFGLLVGINDVISTEKTLTRMGGESRVGLFSPVNYSAPASKLKGKIKLVLLTPAYFEGGWSPVDQGWSAWVGAGRLVSYTAGKPQVFSGWDLVKKQPKSLRHFVPAGSVYYFEDAEWTGLAFTQTPDGETDHSAMGFGNVAIAQWF